MANEGCASSIMRSKVVPDRGAPTIKGTGAAAIDETSKTGVESRDMGIEVAQRRT
jgi:hypothetical protein